MFFSSSDSLFQIMVVGVLSYLALIVMLRISGNRTLSQMNSFDFIITIAMGSTFSSGMLQKSIALADTVGALALLIFMQFLATKASVKSKKVSRLLKSEPVLLFHKGKLLTESMRKARVVEDEIVAAMRSEGLNTLSQVDFVVLETNGKLSIIPIDSTDANSKTCEVDKILLKK